MNLDLVLEKIIVLNQLTNFGYDYYEDKRHFLFIFCIYFIRKLDYIISKIFSYEI